MREPFLKYIETGLPSGFLLVACGLPCTGKTGASEKIAGVRGCRLLRTDTIRLEVLKDEDIFDEKVAGDMGKRMQVYDEMFRRAERALEGGGCVILDATFVTQALRRRAAAIAAKHDRPFVILQAECPQDVAIRRILARTRDDYTSNALTEEAYLDNREKFEPVDLGDIKARHPGLDIIHLTVDTTEDPPEGWYVTGCSER